MSTIVTSNVSDGTLSIPTTYVTNGSAKAWVNFNGTGTVAIRDSMNVSSITDLDTSVYAVNMTNAFAAANYTNLGWFRSSADANWLKQGSTFTTSSFNFEYTSASGTNQTELLIAQTVSFGDLA